MVSIATTHPNWAPPRQTWSPHLRSEKARLTRGKSWLASFMGSAEALPLSEKHPWESSEPSLASTFRSIRRSIVHRLPSFDSPALPALPSPTALRFVLLCGLWYTSSALSSNTGKVILNQFRYPVTLTFIQFGFVAAYCLLFMSPMVQFSKFRRPTPAIIWSTLPMGCFQVGGHIFSSMAMSRIPVSTVHTIKALSPLFTVAAYALIFGVRYSPQTYFSLLPLTFGVILACSSDMSAGNGTGLLCAFGSAIVFVSSNIFFKKIMPSNSSTTSHKLDKLNLLFYSSSMAFILMIPIWMYSDLPVLLASAADPSHIGHPPHDSGAHTAHFHTLASHFLANGTVHFAQNIIAFILLAQTSPVTYSIASLIKRVVVIVIALVWFAQPTHIVQGLGIALTFGGLWLYNRAKSDVEQGEKRARRVAAARDMELPTTLSELPPEEVPVTAALEAVPAEKAFASAYGRPGGLAHIHPTAAAGNSPSSAHPPSFPSGPTPSARPPSPSYYPARLPNLHIKITPPSAGAGKPVSPIDSYPSPPPSVDSPPPEQEYPWGSSAHTGAGVTARRGSVAGYGSPRVLMGEGAVPRAVAA